MRTTPSPSPTYSPKLPNCAIQFSYSTLSCKGVERDLSTQYDNDSAARLQDFVLKFAKFKFNYKREYIVFQHNLTSV